MSVCKKALLLILILTAPLVIAIAIRHYLVKQYSDETDEKPGSETPSVGAVLDRSHRMFA